MELFEAMATTRSIRRFEDRPVSEELIWECLQAALYAPTGHNTQPWRACVLAGDEARALLGPAYRKGWEWSSGLYNIERPEPDDMSRSARSRRSMYDFVERFEEIPYYVVFCAEHWDNLPDHLAGANVYPGMQNFMLAARSFGLGTVPTMWFMECEEELRELIGVPEGWRIVGLLPVGYPQGNHGPLRRRPIEEVVFWERWDNVRPRTVEPAPDSASPDSTSDEVAS